MSENRQSWSVAAAILAAGIVLASIVIGKALGEFKAYDRVVSVKGLAEKEFAADQVIWPVSFIVAANDLPTLQQRLDSAAGKVMAFLKAQDLAGVELNRSAPRITDHYAYGSNPQNRPANRYSAQAVLTVRTDRTTAVKKAMSASGDLIAEGVMLSHSYEFQPSFKFTRLNEVKPEMIAAATQNARSAAKQFAQDSGSSVGAIRNARQGLFSITDRDRYTREVKVVRVVTTVDFLLEN